jgi:hypothetical protein
VPSPHGDVLPSRLAIHVSHELSNIYPREHVEDCGNGKENDRRRRHGLKRDITSTIAGTLFLRLSRHFPQLPNPRSNLRISLRCASGRRIEPTNKFFMDNTAHVIGRLATMKARQDASCLGLILIGVDFKVDADWIVAKQKCGGGIKQVAILRLELAALFENILACSGHGV